MQHLKDALHGHQLRHKKSKIEVKPEQVLEEAKEHIKNEFEVKIEDPNQSPAEYPTAVQDAHIKLVAASKLPPPAEKGPEQPSEIPASSGSEESSSLPPHLDELNKRMQIIASRNAAAKQLLAEAEHDPHTPHPVAAVQKGRMRIVTDAAKPAELPSHIAELNKRIRIIASRNTAAKALLSEADKDLQPLPQVAMQKARIRVTVDGGKPLDAPPEKASNVPQGNSSDVPPHIAELDKRMEIIASSNAAAKALLSEADKDLQPLHQVAMQKARMRVAVDAGKPSKTPPGNSPALPPRVAELDKRMEIIASRNAAAKQLLAETGKGGAQPGKPVAEKDAATPAKPVAVQKAHVRIAGAPKAASPTPEAPKGGDIIRYRYHHGANLGSIYVLEKWLTPSAFPPSTPDDQTSELSCVRSWVEQIGIDETKKKFEQRWSKALCDDDWKWLNDTGQCTSIRLPIGYFTLGPDYCKGTPFEPYGAVYANAWGSVKRFVTKARERGVGVLVDLHALPGGANLGEHSGTNLKVVNLWKNTTNLDLAMQCLNFIAKEVGGTDGIIGIQLCNEAVTNADGMYDWYDEVLKAVSAVDSTIPLFISDAWDFGKAVNYVKSKNRVLSGDTQRQNPVVIDTHIYFCFDDKDKACSPAQVIEKVANTLSEFKGKTGKVLETGAAGVVVGEYACTLDPETWKRLPPGQGKDAVTKEFGHKQSEHFSSITGGAYFWTLKMDWMDGGDWGFVAQTKSGAICPPKWLSFSYEEVNGRSQNADSKWPALRDSAAKALVDDSTKAKPTGKSDHALYQKGWELGWNDARAFFRGRSEGWVPIVGADKIGLKDLWMLKRIGDLGLLGSDAFDFEQGMWKGMADFEDVALD